MTIFLIISFSIIAALYLISVHYEIIAAQEQDEVNKKILKDNLYKYKFMDEVMLKNAVRLLVGGYLFDSLSSQEEIERLNSVPRILEQVAEEYENRIKQFIPPS